MESSDLALSVSWFQLSPKSVIFSETLQSMSSISFENNAILVYILKISDCRYMYTRKKCGFHYSKVVGGEITKSHVTLPLIMNPCFLASRPRYMHLSTKSPYLNLQLFQIFLRLQNSLTLADIISCKLNYKICSYCFIYLGGNTTSTIWMSTNKRICHF